MKEILENAFEFIASGEDNIKKQRWNAAVSDVEVFDKPRTLVRGKLRASKSPNKLRTLVRRIRQGLFDFFKSISNFCDYLIYKEIKIFPKNHNERFDLLKKYFKKIHEEIIALFKTYRDSYNLRLKKEDAETLQKYANELRKTVGN